MRITKRSILMIVTIMVFLNTLGTIENYHTIIPVQRLENNYCVEYEINKNFKYINYHENLMFINNNSAKNVSYDEVLEFISKDQTDKTRYVKDKWNCVNYAQTVHNNAEKQGIRCGLVEVKFKNLRATHAFNVFNTTDKGLVFIDCTGSENNYNLYGDKQINLTLNEPFRGRYLNNRGSFKNESKIAKSISIYF
ncbi:hypothetical protein RSJ42_06035 [Methanosarcina hadiensis]|uniref:hypothetical protein n=1 Tax=Methanosarcina hadiensis TaxID=3078083 RepID=UPI0039775092